MFCQGTPKSQQLSDRNSSSQLRVFVCLLSCCMFWICDAFRRLCRFFLFLLRLIVCFFTRHCYLEVDTHSRAWCVIAYVDLIFVVVAVVVLFNSREYMSCFVVALHHTHSHYTLCPRWVWQQSNNCSNSFHFGALNLIQCDNFTNAFVYLYGYIDCRLDWKCCQRLFLP